MPESFPILTLDEPTVLHLAAIIDSSDDAIISKTLEGIIQSWNKAAERIFGYRAEEMIGKSITLLIPADRQGEEPTILQRLKRGERVDHYETVRVRKDGRHLPVSLTISPVRDRAGRIVGASKIARDITESKRAQDAITASLKEKELLLKEIHHRVKNNLQIVSSLLNLQANSIKDPALRAMFESSQSRIRSMALVHEKLYQSNDLSRVDMAQYLRELAAQLRQSYGAAEAIRVAVEGEAPPLSIDLAVPCALAAQELVVNAIKHAFPRGGSGQVRVRLAGGNGVCTLTIADTGVGLPRDVDLRSAGSLGLSLVSDLVEQLHGTVALDRTQGTTWTITFPVNKEQAGSPHAVRADADQGR